MNKYKSVVKNIIAPVVFCALFSVSSFASAAPTDAFRGLSGTLDIAGGTAHIPVMRQAAQNIMAAYPDIRITVAGGGSGVGVMQVGEGLVGIGNTGRPLKDSEIAKFGLKSFPFAIDGVAVAVNPENPVKKLTSEQIAAVYAGKIKDWKELGGEPGAIDVYGREDGSGTRETFADRLLNGGEEGSFINVAGSNGAMKTAVARDRRAIGYVGIGHLDDSVAGVTVDGMTPSQAAAADGSYKIVRNLYMNTKGEPSGLVAAFIDYIYSEDGAKIIRDSGYIPLPRP